MNYIIKRDKLKRILKSYIGDLEESKYYHGDYGNYFPSWVNSKGNTIFILVNNYKRNPTDERIGIDGSFYRSLRNMMSVDNMSEDNYNIFSSIITEIANEIVGINSPSLLVYNLNP